MKYQLKRGFPPFEMVDGPLARRKYVRGRLYVETEIPEQYRGRFETVEDKKNISRKDTKGAKAVGAGFKPARTEPARINVPAGDASIVDPGKEE